MPALNSRHLLLAGALLLTLAAAWFAPPPEDADIATPAAIDRAGGGRAPAAGDGNRDGNRSGNRSGNRDGNRDGNRKDAGKPVAAVAVAPEASAADRRQALAALDIGLISARGGTAGVGDLFAGKSWEPPPPPPPPEPPPPPPAPPPPPQAPPLPFKHLGKLHELGAAATHYLMDGDQMLIVSVGDLIGTQYRLEKEDGGYLQFVYLPLNIKQSLPISGAP